MTSWQLAVFLAGSVLPSFLVSLAATAIVRRLAPAWGLIDRPATRKVHMTPTPLGGGIAIWLAMVLPLIAGLIVAALVQRELLSRELVPDFAAPHLGGVWQQSPKLLGLIAAATILMLLGLADDARGLPWQLRLGTQAIVAGLCVYLIDDLRLTAFLDLPLLTGALSVLWIVGLINSFNMLDNMDGLSGGVAAIAAAMLVAILLLAPDPTTRQPQVFVAGLLLVVVGSVLGFLWHNRPPAAIFMGDAGSYVLGFFLAVASLLATYASYRTTSEGSAGRHAVLAPLCVLAVPLYDMVTVIAIRLAQGRSPFEADKNHFSHRLVDLGLTKPQAVLTIYLTTATCGLAGLLLHQVNAAGAILIVLLVVCVLAVIAIIETAARRKVLQQQSRKESP
jgi:UDP-GlcNAc:undecaprenyl-phosphate/decaprenyl-phosphate GlcNAc-1-phosphate transferase